MFKSLGAAQAQLGTQSTRIKSHIVEGGAAQRVFLLWHSHGGRLFPKLNDLQLLLQAADGLGMLRCIMGTRVRRGME